MFLQILFVALALTVSGCSQKQEQKTDDKNVVKVWHWMTDRQAAFDKLSEKYFNETGVKVVFETYAPTDVYKNKITAAASGQRDRKAQPRSRS